MPLSKLSYHADFVVYPVLVLAAALHSPWDSGLACATWLLAACAGLLAWTAIEYAIHRWVLHHLPPFSALHALHHAQPMALIGTPTWVSAALFLGLWWGLAQVASTSLADGMAAGLMSGYGVYALIHDAVHHRVARPGSWLHRAKLRHALHHHRPQVGCNFGVSSGVWDAALGTTAAPLQGSGGR